MRALLVTLALLAAPSVAFAHTGSVFKTAINFIPMLVVFLPMFVSRLFKSINNFFGKKRD
ncbi:hypothetical protein [Anaerospora hongkongensis]|uniref:hypothetical protein n=1 Tax=Anaerospora hongkongensis TaxID=244830 RepID=UPI00289AF796|nr:hypothetical protein [Anaerospora hongkongensis]